MTDKTSSNNAQKTSQTDTLRGLVMVSLTLIFVSLYAAALFGWLRPLTDITMVTRLEPIIFVIIGYYFGRLPAQHTEKTLKEEINRQTQKADAAGHANVRALLERESLEEKIKNTKIVLALSPHFPQTFASSAERGSERKSSAARDAPPGDPVNAAIRILSS